MRRICETRMKDFTINSRKIGREFTFSRPGDYYIYVDINGQNGTLGNQICDGGALNGNTLGYRGDDQDEFEAICRNWFRAYRDAWEEVNE